MIFAVSTTLPGHYGTNTADAMCPFFFCRANRHLSCKQCDEMETCSLAIIWQQKYIFPLWLDVGINGWKDILPITRQRWTVSKRFYLYHWHKMTFHKQHNKKIKLMYLCLSSMASGWKSSCHSTTDLSWMSSLLASCIEDLQQQWW